ncbi:hypothetical protein MUK42_11318 [Musa troglodytarum]|uniref:Uncharacterized protein n=1 Tax=Musa troglodytarum TaxID=320322 RepID=A0A9E7GDA6_9LILI|nr:hypothetical protein MUK42_11318 [Musa troglodytarum]
MAQLRTSWPDARRTKPPADSRPNLWLDTQYPDRYIGLAVTKKSLKKGEIFRWKAKRGKHLTVSPSTTCLHGGVAFSAHVELKWRCVRATWPQQHPFDVGRDAWAARHASSLRRSGGASYGTTIVAASSIHRRMIRRFMLAESWMRRRKV